MDAAAPASAGKGAPGGRVAPGRRGGSAARGALIVVRPAGPVSAAVADGGRRRTLAAHRRPVPGIAVTSGSAVVSTVSALRGGTRGWAAAALRRRLDRVEDALEVEVRG